jgi:ABC-type amino acid transport system permease subunit
MAVIPYGQMEEALKLDMTQLQSLGHDILPQALTSALPQLSILKFA